MRTIQPFYTKQPITSITLHGDVVLNLNAQDELYCTVKLNCWSADGQKVDVWTINFTKAEVDQWAEDDEILLDLAIAKMSWIQV